jgi:diaminopimelate decarboxylase
MCPEGEVMTGFVRSGDRLTADGVDLGALADEFGTPLYVYSAAFVERAYSAYASAFSGVPHRICYAMKANASGALLRILARLGAGVDIVSGGELLAALRAGFPADRVVFAGVGKTDAELEAGLLHGISHFNAESEEELDRLSTAALRRGTTARASLRVNPNIDARSHPYISTGLAESKFGVDIAVAPEVVRRARGKRGVELVGLQCHIGSQMLDLEQIAEAARELAGLSRQLLAEGHPLRVLDLGGGLGIDYERSGAPDPEALAKIVRPALEGLDLELLVEPGRSLVAGAGVLLTRVLYVKDSARHRFVIVDAGMNDLIRPSLYDAYHAIEPLVDRARPSRTVDVVGPVCESADFLARGRVLPEIGPGEVLAVRDVGAYSFVMASNYNFRPRPAEVLVEGGRARLVRRRESFDDMVRNELPD